MTVQAAGIVVPVEELTEFAEITGELLGMNGRVFPSFPGQSIAGRVRRGSQPRLPDRPDHSLFALIAKQTRCRAAHVPGYPCDESLRLVVGFPPRLTAEFHHEPSRAVREDLHLFGVKVLLFHVVE